MNTLINAELRLREGHCKINKQLYNEDALIIEFNR